MSASVAGIGLVIISTAAGITIWDRINRINKNGKQSQDRLSCLEAVVGDDGIFDAVRSIRNVVSLLHANMDNYICVQSWLIYFNSIYCDFLFQFQIRNIQNANIVDLNIVMPNAMVNRESIVAFLRTVSNFNIMIPEAPRCPTAAASTNMFFKLK